MNGFADLARFVSAGTAEAAAVREKLGLHIADALGAWLAGLATAEGRALIRLRNGQPKNVFDDVALHCAATRLSEVDDIHLASMTTPGSIVIPAALTLAAALKSDKADLAPAILGGYEAMIRLGLAIKGPEVLYRGIWPTYFGAPCAAAAVAARLLKLDAGQTEHALALALTLAAPSVGQHHAATTSRWLSVGQAARNGLSAAYAARAGFTSDTNVLTSRLLPDVFGIEPDLAQMAGGDTPRFMQVSFKPWCAARQTMPATQALRDILGEGVAVSDVTAIEAYVLPPHLKMIDHGVKAGDRASHLTSLPYQMAVAALAPESNLDVAQAPASIGPDMADLMGRIKVAPDPALLAGYPAVWPARVVVVSRDSRRSRLIRHVPGDPALPFTADDVRTKFERLVAPALGAARAQSLYRRGLALLSGDADAAGVIADLEQACAAGAGNT